MNKVGKLMAFTILLLPYNLLLLAYNLTPKDIRFWVLVIPAYLGVDWIVEKLNKIK